MKPCPFRIEGLGPEVPVCTAASGAPVLAGGGCLCDSCQIPEEFARIGKPCLYLVPLRIPDGERAGYYFACRWFYRLHPQRLHSHTWLCGGCSYWFPRPPEEMIRDMSEITDVVRNAFLNGIEEEAPHPLPAPDPPRSRSGGWLHRLASPHRALETTRKKTR